MIWQSYSTKDSLGMKKAKSLSLSQSRWGFRVNETCDQNKLPILLGLCMIMLNKSRVYKNTVGMDLIVLKGLLLKPRTTLSSCICPHLSIWILGYKIISFSFSSHSWPASLRLPLNFQVRTVFLYFYWYLWKSMVFIWASTSGNFCSGL